MEYAQQPKSYEEKVHEAQEALALERTKAETERVSAGTPTTLPVQTRQDQPTSSNATSWFWWKNKSTPAVAAAEPTPVPPKVDVPAAPVAKIETAPKKDGSWLPWKN